MLVKYDRIRCDMVGCNAELAFNRPYHLECVMEEGGWRWIFGMRRDGGYRDVHICPDHTISDWMVQQNIGVRQ